MESQNAPLWNAVHEGKVKSPCDQGLIIQIGTIEALLNKEELAHLHEPLGETVQVYLENPKSPQVSLLKAKELLEVQEAARAFEAKEPVLGIVVGSIKGGYSVSLLAKTREEADQGLGLRAFLPFSHAGLEPGQTAHFSHRTPYEFKIRDFNPAEGNIIVSRRAILQKEKRTLQKDFWESAEVGQIVEGVVKNLVPYGAFVSLTGVDALLHASDMSWEQHPSKKDRVQVGQKIQAKILELDKKSKKIKIGLKQLKPDPWQQIEEACQVGMEITGTVVAISDFGIFVHVAEGLEGLVHTSELSWQRVKHPSQLYKIGDEVKARILSLDQEAHRISLSIKALQDNPVQKLQEKFPVGTVLKTKVVGIQEYGLFVQLDEEITGLVHIGEISWTEQISNLEKHYQEGQEIEVAVMGYDAARQRVSCSIKRITQDPWKEWKLKYAKGTRHEVEVKRVAPGGFECQLEPDLKAFCPNKQLGEFKPKLGEKVGIEVTACDPAQAKVTISVKARTDHEAREDYENYIKKQKSARSGATLGDALKGFEV